MGRQENPPGRPAKAGAEHHTIYGNAVKGRAVLQDSVPFLRPPGVFGLRPPGERRPPGPRLSC